MSDGTRLSARVWRPEGAGPFPAILEYIPYRKRDMVRARDERNHPYFAANGYVCLRVDMRGSGDSEGFMDDMYMQVEMNDAREVIEWIAGQHWCSGRVGMFGTSWGGTASLQAAVNAPAPLKAVIANCATTDRFEDDIHWMGGEMLTDSFEWGATLPAILAAPPDPANVGKRWRKMWRERLNELTFPLMSWVECCVKNEYWQRGSVESCAEELSCPILSIGGWSDRYSNSVLNLVKMRPDISWGVVGPWGHHYPDQGEPGPAIGFQDLALEWWDHWLKGHAGESLDWPRLRVWRREFDPPQNRLALRNGEWIQIDDIGQAESTTLYFDRSKLAKAPSETDLQLQVPNDLRHGECAGDTGYFGREGGLPLDQSEDDKRSLCFDSEPLAEDFDLSGHAELIICVKVDARKAQLACRICEVTPDGRSNLAVRQIRNLGIQDSMDWLTPPFPNAEAFFRIRFPSTVYRFKKGSRIRLAIGTSYWPLVWPSPRLADIRMLAHQSRLELPRFTCAQPLAKPFPKVRQLPAKQTWKVDSEGPLLRERRISKNGRVLSRWELPRTTFNYPDINVEISIEAWTHYHLVTQYPLDALFLISHTIEIRREDGCAKINCKVQADAAGDGFAVTGRFYVAWNDATVTELDVDEVLHLDPRLYFYSQ